MKLVRTVLLIGIGAIIAGCAASGPSDKQSVNPPRLVNRDNRSDNHKDNDKDNRNDNCWDSTHLHSTCSWDNPSAFGPVPADLAQTAQKVCSELDAKDVQYKATGYHSEAQDLDGKPVPGGGYFCVRK